MLQSSRTCPKRLYSKAALWGENVPHACDFRHSSGQSVWLGDGSYRWIDPDIQPQGHALRRLAALMNGQWAYVHDETTRHVEGLSTSYRQRPTIRHWALHLMLVIPLLSYASLDSVDPNECSLNFTVAVTSVIKFWSVGSGTINATVTISALWREFYICRSK